MKTAFWAPYISDNTIKAICWTLIHSLWIGVIAALLAAAIISFARKSASKRRYALLCSILVLFVVSVSVIFFVQLQANKTTVAAVGPVRVINLRVTAVANHPEQVVSTDIFTKSLSVFNQNLALLFLVWLLFFVMKSLKMISGLLYIQRIRNYKIQPLSKDIKARLEHFSRELGIKQKVQLVQSELVKIPVAVGWLKPMILLPVGIALQLSPEQLDGILWHELAHIRRRDYLVNMLQGLTEAIFFFNPGLLWLSSLIRAEREACCDDIVLSRTNSKTNYLEALLAFGHGEFKHTNLAMSIGSGNQLRDRLKRMINQENKRLNKAEKSVLAIGLIILSAFTAVSKEIPAFKHLTVKITGKPATKAFYISAYHLPKKLNDTPGKPQIRESYDVIVTDTAIRFTSILFKTNNADLNNSEMNAMDNKGYNYHFVVVDGKITSMDINDTKIADDKLANYDYMIRNIGRELASKRHMRELDVLYEKEAREEMHADNDDRLVKSKFRRDSLEDMKSRDIIPKYDEFKIDAKQHKLEQMQKRVRDDSIRYYTQLNRAKRVIADLVAENVVPNEDAVKWFGLTENELVVNGNKQADILHVRLVNKYDIHKDYGLFYGPVKITGTGVFVGDEADNRAYPQSGKAKPIAAVAREKMVSDKLRDMQYRARESEKIDRENADLAHVTAEKDFQAAQKLKQLRGQYVEVDMKAAITGVITDLVDANIIGNKKDLDFFNLTNTELIVNGKKQSEEIHQKLKYKYFRGPYYNSNADIADDPNFGLHFNAKNGTRGIGITEKSDSPW